MGRTIVILWVMPGCHHCHALRPKFNRVAARFRGKVPIYVLNANDPRNQMLADRCQIGATPTTCVLRQPYGILKSEGDISEGELESLFTTALAYR